MNHLNEKLRVIRTQKAVLTKKMKEETNREKLMKFAVEIQELTKEEKECLRKLGE